MFIFACAITHLVLLTKETKKEGPFIDAIQKSPTSIIVCIICFFSVWSILGLAGFHTFLTTSNLTTNEDIKGAYSNKRTHTNYNPFSAGNAILNCHEVLCGPINPSLIDARGYVTEDYLVAMSNSLTSPQQPQAPVLPQMQQPQVVQEAPKPSEVTMAPALEPQPRKMVTSATAPEIAASKKNQQQKLPPIKTSNTTQNLSLTTTNVKAHNRGHVEEKLDLDQTTMIGSALDLDSLESAGEDEDINKEIATATGSSHAGSQVGLLKLSAV